MGKFETGNKAGQKFSSERQPKKNGRKPALYKQLAAMVGKQVKLELSREDFIKIQRWVLERTKSELQAIAKDPETPIFMLNLVTAIVGDVQNGKYDTIERTYDRLWGKAIQPTQMTGDVQLESTYNLTELSDEEINRLGEIMAKAAQVKNYAEPEQNIELAE